MNMKKLVVGAVIVGTLGFSGLGLGTSVANAYTPAPSNISSVQWQQDDGGWCFPWACWRPWGGDDWGRGDWGGGDGGWGHGHWGGGDWGRGGD